MYLSGFSHGNKQSGEKFKPSLNKIKPIVWCTVYTILYTVTSTPCFCCSVYFSFYFSSARIRVEPDRYINMGHTVYMGYMEALDIWGTWKHLLSACMRYKEAMSKNCEFYRFNQNLFSISIFFLSCPSELNKLD